MTPDALRFTLHVDHKQHLHVGSRAVDAIVQVRAEHTESGPGAREPVAAEVIVIDTSASMTGKKIDLACQAAIKAVEVLRDGTYFAVVSGQSFATAVYPAQGMARASAATREAAARALTQVTARGGTAMSTWLTLTRELLAGCRAADIRHAILLTDGLNIEGDAPLREALKRSKGEFVCDSRGIGDDWSFIQLREIAHTLLGTWKPVASPDLLAEDFRAVMTATMDKRAAGVRLRVSTWGGGKVTYFARVMPTMEDLTAKGVRVDDRTREFPLGDWGEQLADYHLRVDVGQRDLDVETGGQARAAKITVVVPTGSGAGQEQDGHEQIVATGTVKVSWTENPMLSSMIPARVSEYTGQEELRVAVEEGLAAWKQRHDAEAVDRLGLAVRLAHEIGQQELLESLSRIVVIEDPATGGIRLRPREQVALGSDNWSSYLSGLSRYVAPGEPGVNGASGAPGVSGHA